ncbi:hypothetical protein Poly59_41300 [Rubripirellula reticaptiva]|uniref:Uncharacterized protein n=1 Tax=Rubripirellula reticaptiva TaxID=2528013 RepID=A0A5C6ELZ5_9BACT|nr:hypothetical protein Poly59_41300 [Rubripirellula reticaptiva]
MIIALGRGAATSSDQANHKQHKEDDEKYLGDHCSGAAEDAKTKCTGNQSDN